METGFITPNLNYKRPRKELKALQDGRIKVIDDVTPWEGGYVGINSFGFGGANAHILLKSHTKEKVNGGAPEDNLARLVVVSGRTEEAVNVMLDDIQSRPVDVEHIRLLHDLHAEEISGHLYRGYILMPPRGLPEAAVRDVQHYPGGKRSIWFVFSGMGSQWAGMGEALMRIPVFARAIQKCDAALKPHGVDIIDVITSKDEKIFDNILNSSVGIAAVQIGLVDILTSVGIVPDRIIGHSAGELGCAYADGSFTAEQMILSSYSRGLACLQNKLILGAMAAVGAGYQNLVDLCPPDIDVACHNGPQSSTISGPADSIKTFVAELQSRGIFAREVASSNIAFHSRYIAEVGPKILAYLREVIPAPKPRSPKWLSTSIPRSEWNSSKAALSGAEYHTNNVLSPVLFEEVLNLIPKDAVTIEIAPHGLLQAILKRSLNEGVTNVALTRRGHEDGSQLALQALGKLYQAGLQQQLKNLYPEVHLPVSRGTPMISPVIKWEHSDDWHVTANKLQEKIRSGERSVDVNLADKNYEYMAGHVIDGRNLLPATGYLGLIWQTLAMMRGDSCIEVPVVFEDVRFLRAASIPKEGVVKLTVMVQKGTGRFEVAKQDATLVTGIIRIALNPAEEKLKISPKTDEEYEEEFMTSRDIYKELRLRGYQYSGLFRGVKSATLEGTKGRVAWKDNWEAFMDNMIQMKTLGMDTRIPFIPSRIKKLVIDTKAHMRLISDMSEEEKEFPVKIYKNIDVITAGGIEIRGLRTSTVVRGKATSDPVLEQQRFVSHRDKEEITLKTAAYLAVHLALENHPDLKIKTIELVDQTDNDVSTNDLASPILLEVLNNLPLIQPDVNVVAPSATFGKDVLCSSITVTDANILSKDTNAQLAVSRGLLSDVNSERLTQLLSALKDGGFMLAREAPGAEEKIFGTARRESLDVLLEKRTMDELVILLRKRGQEPKWTDIVEIDNTEFSWVPKLKAAVEAAAADEADGDRRILIVGQGDFGNGLLGLVNCLRKEPGGKAVRSLLIQDPEAPQFSLRNSIYSEQLKLDLAVNVLRPGRVWGSYRHLPLAAPKPRPVHHAQVSQLVRGDLSSLFWMEGPVQRDFQDKNLLRVVYSSVNFRDVMMATGKFASEVAGNDKQLQECIIGFEYSGFDSNGKGVMGLASFGAMTNLRICDQDLQFDVPEGWSLEDAATVPVVYGTCYYAMYMTGRIKKGDKILIHAGTGGVGQAAINLALREGCEVFTTVGTAEKRNFIRKQFPQIDDSHIGNSRDTSFEQMILEATNGHGVDIVLNSSAEEKLQASVRCLGRGGRFLEIGKFDMAADSSLGIEAFLNEISFHGISLDYIFEATAEKRKELSSLVIQGLKSGAVKPLPRTVFAKDQVEAAFRCMAAGKHIGKVIIKVREESDIPETPILAKPRYHCLGDRSYVILGGLGGFGLELADWLVHRGARKLVLTSRKGVSNGYQRSRIQIWRRYGVEVVIVAGKDAATREVCEDTLQVATSLGPVDAIFNLAVVLKDALLVNQTEETFADPFRAKAWSTKQLDQTSRVLCPQLRHFVVFSSVSSGRGNAGQTNYGMANSVMERICEMRVAEGLPGLAIQWGAIADVGLVAEMQEDDEKLVIGGTLQQKVSSCLQELDGFLKQNCPIVSSMVVAEKRAIDVKGATIVGTIMNIMGLKNLKTISQHTTLSGLGMDSMMAVEINLTLKREFDVFLTAHEIRDINFLKLVEMDAARSAEG